MFKKFILLIMISCMCWYCCNNSNFNVEAATEDLVFTMTKVVDGGNWKMITIEVQNNTEYTYSYGWVNGATFTFENKENGKNVTSKLNSLSAGYIPTGKSTRVFNVNFSYDVTNFYVSGIIQLDGNLPAKNYISKTYVGNIPNDYILENAAGLSGLSFDVLSIEDDTLTKHITIRITNNTEKNYSLGWVDSRIIFYNYLGSKKSQKISISDSKIYDGTTILEFYIEMEGELSGIKFDGVCELENGLPVSNTAFDVDCNMSSYRLINQNESLTMTLVGIKKTGEDFINTVIIKFVNNTNYTYSFGWAGSSKITLSNGEESISKTISSLKFRIEPGTSSCEFDINMSLSGVISSMSFSDIRQLDENGAPKYSNSSYKGFNKLGTIDKNYTVEDYQSTTENGQMNANDSANLTFTLVKIEKNKDKIVKLHINVNNSSNETYTFGWVRSCKINIKTSDGQTHNYQISSMDYEYIKNGNNSYVFDVSFDGEITSIEFEGLKRMNGKLPVNYSDFSEECSIVKYETVEESNVLFNLDQNYLVIGGIVLVALIIVFVIKKKRG